MICIAVLGLLFILVLLRVCKPPKGKHQNLKPTPVEQEDARVREEKARIASQETKEDLVIVDCVVKKYDGEDPNPPETTESDRPVIM